MDAQLKLLLVLLVNIAIMFGLRATGKNFWPTRPGLPSARWARLSAATLAVAGAYFTKRFGGPDVIMLIPEPGERVIYWLGYLITFGVWFATAVLWLFATVFNDLWLQLDILKYRRKNRLK